MLNSSQLTQLGGAASFSALTQNQQPSFLQGNKMDERERKDALKRAEAEAVIAGEKLFLLVSHKLQELDVTTFIEQMLQENGIGYRFSDKIFDNSIMWLSARQYISKLEKEDGEPGRGSSKESEMPGTAESQMGSKSNTTYRGHVDTTYDNEFILIYYESE